MSEWKECNLETLVSKIGSGATPSGGSNSYKDEGISLIRSQNVLDFNFSFSGLAFLDDEQADSLKNVVIEKNDILLNITGDSVARCCLVPEAVIPARVNQHVSIIRLKSDLADYRFIFYFLQAIKEELLSQAEIGATRRALTKGMIENLDILLPPLPEQKAIAAVLSSLDDKIDLLHHQNKTLEALAETLFRQWFVEEAEDDWEEFEIKQLCNLQYGFTQSSSIEKVGPKFLRITDIQGGKVKWKNVPYCIASENDISKYQLRTGDIVVARTGASTGENLYIYNPPLAVFASYLVRLQFKYVEIARYLAMHMRSTDYFEYINGITSGSAQPNANAQMLSTFPIKLPPEKILKKFYISVKDYDEKIYQNQLQICTLEKLRDTLLPKLMSGEVRVKISEL